MRQNSSSRQPHDSIAPLSRRAFLKRGAIAAAGIPLAAMAVGAGDAASSPSRAPQQNSASTDAFTFVHLADTHARRARKGNLGYERCVEEVNALRPRPAFVLMGGDNAFTGLWTPEDEFADQVELFKTISNRLEMPHYHCIGNHDTLGLSNRRQVPADHPEIGKAFFMKRLGMNRSYYSFDHGGWHFVILDSIYQIESPHGPDWRGRIGQEQLDWLRHDLAAVAGRPSIVVSHIPAFSHLGQIQGDREMLAIHQNVLDDGRDLRLIIERHGVKALIQGHIHKPEEFRYEGVWYLTSPAVSASWWGGNWLGGFGNGFTIFTAHPDGRLEWEHRYFAWEHHLEPGDDLERMRNAEWAQFSREQEELLQQEIAAAGRQ